jgi:deazaflavin-dependent oxidoreductase (nitroreductase family)
MNLFQRLCLAVENAILTYLVPRDHPGPVWRWFFKLPVVFYRAGLGWLIGRRVLLLHTIGRKTGKRWLTPLEYSYDAVTDTYTVMAGWGGKTDWYRNARAYPNVHVQVGRRVFSTLAEPVSQETVVQMMAEIVRVNPCVLRTFARWADGSVDGSFDSLRDVTIHFSVLSLHSTGASEREDV